MIIFIEDYPYKYEELDKAGRDSFLFSSSDDTAITPYVGYFYSNDLEDSVFVLPKVLLTDEGGKILGRYYATDIINDKSRENAGLTEEDNSFLYELSVWLYQAIAKYDRRSSSKTVRTGERIRNVMSRKGDESSTFLDIVISLQKFHKEHKNLFTYITRVNSSGNNKIHWAKTVSKKQPIIQRCTPVYTDFFNRKKAIDFDEELIILFYSVLNYLHEKYFFKVVPVVNYEIISLGKIESMITNGKGTRRLKSIRRKYFTDELVELWNLLYTFFEKSELIASKKYSQENLLVHNFELVFEDMIDYIIGDDRLVRTKLKEQKDGKIIDHIYADKSLLDNDSEIYFIGDSKYYKETTEYSEKVRYKQYTYAKNVIQYNIDIMNGKDPENTSLGKLRYRDKITEGYNITPNFFIRAAIHPDNLRYDEPLLNLTGTNESDHFPNRLFDRDSLFVASYSINFLYVLAAYVDTSSNEFFKKHTRQQFREDIIKFLHKSFDFYEVAPKDILLPEFVKKHFYLLRGKIYRLSENSCTLILALNKGEKFCVNNKTLLEEISQDAVVDKMEKVFNEQKKSIQNDNPNQETL